MSTYGEVPPTGDAVTALEVKDPREHHWFIEPTEPVGPRFTISIVVAQFVFFVALLGPAIIGVGIKVQSIVPDAEKTTALAIVAGVGALANALPQTLAPAIGGVLLAVNSATNQNYDLLLWVAGIASVLGAIVILPIKKVR